MHNSKILEAQIQILNYQLALKILIELKSKLHILGQDKEMT